MLIQFKIIDVFVPNFKKGKNKMHSNEKIAKTSIHNQSYTSIQKLTISGIVIALYCVIMYFTQSISFGPYQIRIATSLYALSFLSPFLVIPLGIANMLSNIIGGLGPIDIFGGLFVGILTAFLNAVIRKFKLPSWICAIPIIIVPGTIVPIWLSAITSIPYSALVISICIGQITPGIVGVLLIKPLSRIIK